MKREYLDKMLVRVDPDQHDPPNGWDWATLLDVVPRDVKLLSSTYVGHIDEKEEETDGRDDEDGTDGAEGPGEATLPGLGDAAGSA